MTLGAGSSPGWCPRFQGKLKNAVVATSHSVGNTARESLATKEEMWGFMSWFLSVQSKLGLGGMVRNWP